MARDIYVVAHTQSRHHVEGLIGGWYDSELTALGRRQAEVVAGALAERIGAGQPVEIFASDLKRAVQTAEPIAERFGVSVTHWPDLREWSLGVAGGKPQSWLEGRLTPPPRDEGRLDARDGIEGSETRRAFATRIYRAMDAILASACPTQIIVTHGGAVTFVVAAWIKMPLESVGWVKFHSSPGGVTHLLEDDEQANRTVMVLNDRTPLAGVV